MTRRLFVLDTNVLMHDPGALFRFQEHDVYLPMVVLEELDLAKKGDSEVARNVRQVSRVLDELIERCDRPSIEQGIRFSSSERSTGRLFFQTHAFSGVSGTIPGKPLENSILGAAMALQKTQPDLSVTLVSKDINRRIKARVLGIHAEDYYNDKTLDDINLLYSGMIKVPGHVWANSQRNAESRHVDGCVLYTLQGPEVRDWHLNQCVHTDDDSLEAVVQERDGERAVVAVVRDYRLPGNTVWGISARNREQNFAINLLMNADIEFVSLLGTAGTGKTLLALASGLTQTLEDKRYREIVMTRATVPVGDDIGFLPGSEEEKMTPWMGALMDNLEVLTHSDAGGEWGKAATNDMLNSRIKIRSLNFMRGRTFLNRYIIVDEAQNLTPKQMKTLITRAGPGTKVVCLGNVAQIDTPYLTETTSGLTYVVDRFKTWRHGGHVTLLRGERSRLADHATEVL